MKALVWSLGYPPQHFSSSLDLIDEYRAQVRETKRGSPSINYEYKTRFISQDPYNEGIKDQLVPATHQRALVI